jgi:hypothetical protein
MKKPAIVLIREPQEAVLSLMVRLPYLSAGQALRSYIGFYRPLLPFLRRFVVGPFGEVLSDFGGIIRQVNQRFGTDFREFHPTKEHLRAVKEEVDRWDRGAFGSREGAERGGASPNELRDRLKEGLRPAYRHPRLVAQRAAAESVYRRFVEHRETS